LKPKGSAEDSSEDQEDQSSDEDDEPAFTTLESKALKRDQKIKKQLQEAEDELQANIKESKKFSLKEEEEEDKAEPRDLQDLQRRIQEIVGVLSNFTENREPGVSRSTYLARVQRSILFSILIFFVINFRFALLFIFS
jgi:ribosomal RNA methyltransferase Nop2